ncbi:MAG: CRISPR-associated ring nuclease Csm6 [Deltaproteobacteria bacterium]|jgi:CRISPR-associated protein (TIGR02584 family)|nr:CRISPR-associated ring nuclease Csm6 [Deltaproteobacteria bacterium]
MKNILLAVVGLSPQVITETLYAIFKSGKNIDEIIVITTNQGKEKIYSTLLAGQDGNFDKFFEEYNIPRNSILFNHDSIHVICDEHGNTISDLVSEDENRYLLKLCLEITFKLTNMAQTSIYFSVAGGRKTMSSCLTLAAQLYGRPQDRLCHVLVSPEFESSRNFYYPPKINTSVKLKNKNGEPFYKNTKYAKINLVNIPFISIRNYLTHNDLKEVKDPGTLMLSLVQDLKPTLRIDFTLKKIIYKNIELDLMPAHLALYGFFAMQKKNCPKEIKTCGNCTDCFLQSFEILEKQPEITKIYKKLRGARQITEMSGEGIINLDKDNLRSFKSKIKKSLETRFGSPALEEIEIASTGLRPDTRYGIKMDKSKLEIVL